MNCDPLPLPTDAHLLYEYLGRRIADNSADASAAEILADLNAYSDQIARLRAMVHEAQQSVANGEARSIDAVQFIAALRNRIDSESQA